MWPPPHHFGQIIGGEPAPPPPPLYPPRGPPRPLDFGLPPGPSALPPLATHNPYGPNAPDKRSMPPWHQWPGGAEHHPQNDSWKADSSWRQQRQQFAPYSNHELYRQQYSQIPLSRPHPATIAHHRPYAAPPHSQFGCEFMPMHSFESPVKVAPPPEYAAQMDYERQLREQYEPRKTFCDFSQNEANGKGVEIRTEPSARRIKLNWKLRLPENTDGKLKLHLTVRLEELEGGLVRGVRANELGMIMEKVLPIHISKAEFNALPGSLYRIDLNVIDSRNKEVASGNIYERATFSLEEMKVLMQKAIDHIGTQMQTFTYLYRCKPKIYWDYVVSETNSEMNVYEKDANGQAASPINKAISGLFFSARLDPKGQVPTQSPFGDVRFMLPAYHILGPQQNFYFADFYCNSRTHYVTVVVCREGSESDSLCRCRLLSLDPFDNPFLLFQTTNSPNVPMAFSVNKNVWVEIYYTENVPLSWGHLHHIRPVGLGTSKIGGLPHNKSCRLCNLYPQGPGIAHPPPEDVEPIKAEKAEQMVEEAQKADLVDADKAEGEEDSFAEQRDDDEAWEADGGKSEVTAGTTIDELRSRLKQMEHSMHNDLINGNANWRVIELSGPSSALLNGLTKRIGQFLDELQSDFGELDAQIDEVETTIWAEEQKEAEEKRKRSKEEIDVKEMGLELIDESVGDDVSNVVSSAVDALLDQVPDCAQQQQQQNRESRVRRLSSSTDHSVERDVKRNRRESN